MRLALSRLSWAVAAMAAWTHAQGFPASAAAAGRALILPGGTTFQFALLPAGTFTMGSPANEPGHQSDETQHQVTLTRGFYLQTTEVTQAQWQAVMGNNPSNFEGDPRPVETVTWWDALAYANAVSAREGVAACYTLSGCSGAVGSGLYSCSSLKVNSANGTPYACEGYRLPTEAEWEYANRAGTTTAFYNGAITSPTGSDPKLDLIGWYYQNSGTATHEVGKKAANGWGLYDVSGNVWEWVWDWYGSYPGTVTDPLGPQSGSYRVIRGGSWYYGARDARAAARIYGAPDLSLAYRGFRLARSRP